MAPGSEHNMNENVRDLIQELNELKQRMYEVQLDLCHQITAFRGDLETAIGIGLVKPAFPCPPGFVRMCKAKVSK